MFNFKSTTVFLRKEKINFFFFFMFKIPVDSIALSSKVSSQPKYGEKQEFTLAIHFSGELMEVHGILG